MPPFKMSQKFFSRAGMTFSHASLEPISELILVPVIGIHVA